MGLRVPRLGSAKAGPKNREFLADLDLGLVNRLEIADSCMKKGRPVAAGGRLLPLTREPRRDDSEGKKRHLGQSGEKPSGS